jgi:hypothetical protein
MSNPRYCSYLWLLLVLAPVVARADLNQSQARKLIQALGGDSVRVQQVRSNSAESAEVTAELQLVFRVTQHEGRWRLSEVRTAPTRWERVDYIAEAARVVLRGDECDAPAEFARTKESTDLTTKRARCMVASLLGVSLPSDQVRIRNVSPFGFSFGSSDATALITALVELDFRFARDRQGWQLASIKGGNRDWVDVRGLSAAVDHLKRSTATSELSLIAQALDKYRTERGFYVVSDKESVLMDHLTPKYLTPVIRLDPWFRPYQYNGEQSRYSLSSLGPDGKPNTGDDIVVSNP